MIDSDGILSFRRKRLTPFSVHRIGRVNESINQSSFLPSKLRAEGGEKLFRAKQKARKQRERERKEGRVIKSARKSQIFMRSGGETF